MIRRNFYKACVAFVVAFSFVGVAYAKTAEEVLAVGDAKAIGKAIFTELDERDFGFGDLQVNIEMILNNAHGESSQRFMRNKTFEVQDINYGDKTLLAFDVPRDIKGTAFLTHSNILTQDDQWLYLPSLKRVKRISSKNKSGPFMGSEFAYEDISSIEVAKFDYKYLRNEPCGIVDLECFVVERYPLYKHSGYTRQISWVDTTEFRLQKVDFYDRKDELLKTLTYEDYKQYLGQYWRADAFNMVNHQNGKNTKLVWTNYRFRTGLKDEDFTKAVLKRVK